jgi:hypothetical protein
MDMSATVEADVNCRHDSWMDDKFDVMHVGGIEDSTFLLVRAVTLRVASGDYNHDWAIFPHDSVCRCAIGTPRYSYCAAEGVSDPTASGDNVANYRLGSHGSAIAEYCGYQTPPLAPGSPLAYFKTRRGLAMECSS